MRDSSGVLERIEDPSPAGHGLERGNTPPRGDDGCLDMVFPLAAAAGLEAQALDTGCSEDARVEGMLAGLALAACKSPTRLPDHRLTDRHPPLHAIGNDWHDSHIRIARAPKTSRHRRRIEER